MISFSKRSGLKWGITWKTGFFKEKALMYFVGICKDWSFRNVTKSQAYAH